MLVQAQLNTQSRFNHLCNVDSWNQAHARGDSGTMRTLPAALLLVFTVGGCSGSRSSPGQELGAQGRELVINEVFGHGTGPMDPDWIELKNMTGAPIDPAGWRVRDKDPMHLFAIPGGNTIPAGGWLVIYCDDGADGGIAGGLHVPWKLKGGGKSEEVHLTSPRGVEVDGTSFKDIPDGKAWGRLPDGTGMFAVVTPTRGALNY